MLFMNIARKYGYVFMEEATADGAAGGGGTTDAAAEAAAAESEAAKSKTEGDGKGAITEPPVKSPGAVEDNGMQAYIDQHQTDNPALSLALGFLRDAGISPTDPAFTKAEVDGDFTLLKAMLATKSLPGTEAMVAILEKTVADHHAAAEAQEAKTTELVGSILGENKDTILDWVRENAETDEKEGINELLSAGGIYARAAAVLMRDAYVSAGQTVAAKSAVSKGQVSAAGDSTPLSARDYAQKVQELSKELRGDPRNSPQYAQLTRRREMGRSRGL
ncbi:head scaffolding protein [Pectobacterium phage Arno160]|uniref:Scaffolding protein n=1 Tax=Pectobacterium phage Arno160 TaxID=2488835 RepID=A0A3G8F216_9CAUD|nr:head scaffolding protein [Pectobacterium phage Arno160]AZF88096.1 scaffolding protein [Pectobacterium phage Arno160]